MATESREGASALVPSYSTEISLLPSFMATVYVESLYPPLGWDLWAYPSHKVHFPLEGKGGITQHFVNSTGSQGILILPWALKGRLQAGPWRMPDCISNLPERLQPWVGLMEGLSSLQLGLHGSFPSRGWSLHCSVSTLSSPSCSYCCLFAYLFTSCSLSPVLPHLCCPLHLSLFPSHALILPLLSLYLSPPSVSPALVLTYFISGNLTNTHTSTPLSYNC